jgi:hypothetical protein
MKAAKALLCLLVFALAATSSASALAWRGGHARVGVYIGGPAYWYPPYYYPPYYYPQYYPPYYPAYAYPPVVVAPSAPQTYIEQGGGPPAATQSQPPSQAQSSQSQTNWWHYCADTKAYYPYVKECPAGWQRVAPQPQQ